MEGEKYPGRRQWQTILQKMLCPCPGNHQHWILAATFLKNQWDGTVATPWHWKSGQSIGLVDHGNTKKSLCSHPNIPKLPQAVFMWYTSPGHPIAHLHNTVHSNVNYQTPLNLNNTFSSPKLPNQGWTKLYLYLTHLCEHSHRSCTLLVLQHQADRSISQNSIDSAIPLFHYASRITARASPATHGRGIFFAKPTLFRK